MKSREGRVPPVSDEPEAWRRLLADLDRVGAGLEPGGAGAAPPLDRVGKFTVLGELGRGGFGVVYRARDTELGREVALKVPRPELTLTPGLRSRFLREARLAAALDHPNIVPLLEAGEAGSGVYLASAYCPGPTLAAWLRVRGGPAPPRTAARLMARVAEAVQHAHDRGVLHRDIKPSNIILDAADEPSPRLTDFGLARLVDAGGDAASSETQPGGWLGSPPYMAPEQADGEAGAVGPRTDVYAIGATLYEILAGRPPFRGRTPAETIRLVLGVEPVRPRSLHPRIPADLETICLKCLEKDPACRYASSRALADDLGRFLDDRPILARRRGPLDRAARWARRHRPAVAAAALLGLASVVGLGVAASWRYETLRRYNVELTAALDRADRHERLTGRHWYDSQMRLAQQALDSGQAEFAQELLEALRPGPGDRDPRGFDWHYLRRASHREVSGFEADAFGLAASPVGRTLALRGRDGLLLWDLAGWRELGRAPALADVIDGVSFSPDGRSLVSWSGGGGGAGRVRVWDAASARERAALPPIAGGVTWAASSADGRALILLAGPSAGSPTPRVESWDFSPGPAGPRPTSAPIACSAAAVSADGRGLVTSDRAGRIVLSDLANGRAPAAFPAAFPGVRGLALSGGARTVAVALPGAIAFLDAASGRVVGSVATPLVHWLAFSPDGSRLVGLPSEPDREGLILVRDAATAPRVVPMEGVVGRRLHVAFSPCGATLAAGGVGLPATLWDAATGRRRARFPGGTGSVGPMSFAADGRSLIFASGDGRVRSWHFAAAPEPVASLAGHHAEVWALAFTPDGSTLISAGDDHAIRLWDPASGRPRTTLSGHDSLVAALAVSPDGSTLASAGFDRTVRLWDLPSGGPRAVLRGHADRVRALAFSPDGRALASAGSDGTVRLWNTAAGTPLRVFEGHSDTVRALAFRHGGSLLVSSSDDRTIRVWDPDGCRTPVVLTCSKQHAALAFSPDGSLLASGDDWGVVSIREVATWAERTSVKGGDAPVWGLSFSPDGRAIAAACGDAKARLLDPLTGQVTLVLGGHARRVNTVAFSPDGRTLASADHDGAIKLWRAAEAPLLQADHAEGPRASSQEGRERRPPASARPGSR